MKKGICLLALGICALMAVACSSMQKDKSVATEDIGSNETKDEVKDKKKILIKCSKLFWRTTSIKQSVYRYFSAAV